ncbi:polymorphic toxin type 8 domain-containing protein [Snodgrassella alvi]|uniref:polymorphic toxin type 8 domain-containing protein n=1 Tax=Snodgrassella alvi TaxID=1196083 RepID=UPI000C1DE4AC
MRNPRGYELAHSRGYEAAKGYGYQYTELQNTDLHRLQHRYDDYGRKNAPGVSKKYED